MNAFISLADAAERLAGANADSDALASWASLLASQAEQFNIVKSKVSHADVLPGGVSFIASQDEWQIPVFKFDAWCRENGLGATAFGATETEAAAPASKPAAGEPRPVRTSRGLATSQIAEAFACVPGLKRKLGDVNNHSWLLPAQVERGSAPKPSKWCPLELAAILISRGTADDVLNRAFLQEVTLKAWLTEWQESRRERNAFGQ